MAASPPAGTAILVRTLVAGGAVMVLAGVWLLASSALPTLVGVGILVAGLTDLGLANVIAKRS